MIYIAKNHSGKIISIISAKSQELANAYWQGNGIIPFTESTFDLSEDRENEKNGYITPILKTKEIELKDWNAISPKKYIIIE
jgi:hypothetical protein